MKENTPSSVWTFAREVMTVFLLGALAALAVSLCFLVGTATRVVDGLPGLMRFEVAEARDQVIAQIRGARADAVDQIAQTRTAAVGEIAKTRQVLVFETLDARSDLDEKVVAGLTLASIHASVFEDKLDDTNKILLATALPIASAATQVKGVVQQVNDAAPLFLDCDHNPDCLFNRYVGFSKGAEQSMIAIGKAMPGLAKNTEEITGHVDRIATAADLFVTKITAPQPWWQRALGITRDFSILARPFIP